MPALSAVFSFTASSEEGERQFELQKKFAQAIKNRDDALSDLRNQRRNNRGSILQSGKILAGMRLSIVADTAVQDPAGEWRSVLKRAALSESIAREMMLVSQSERINDPMNDINMPNELGALVQVAAMNDDEYALGVTLGQIHEVSSASGLKSYRRSYSDFGRDELLKRLTEHRQSAKGNSKPFTLPTKKRTADHMKMFGKVRFDTKKLDSEDKYHKAADAFRKAVDKIDGVVWAEEPKTATITSLYKDTSGQSATKAKAAADEFLRLLEVIVASDTSKDDKGKDIPLEDKVDKALKVLKAPSKVVLEKLDDDHRIFEVLDDPRKSFAVLAGQMKTREELIDAADSEVDEREEWEK